MKVWRGFLTHFQNWGRGGGREMLVEKSEISPSVTEVIKIMFLTIALVYLVVAD